MRLSLLFNLLQDLPVFTGGMRTQYHRPPDSCHHGHQCCGNGSRRHPNQTISHACHQTGGTLYAQRENLSLPCLLPVPKRCHYCAGPVSMLVFPIIGTDKPNNLNNLNTTKRNARYDFEIILKSTEFRCFPILVPKLYRPIDRIK